jgi:hypothetical protein
MLKDLQSRCGPQEFNKLMFILQSPSITEHIEYKNWSPLSGRLRAFEKIRINLELIYPILKDEIKIESRLMNEFILASFLKNQNYLKEINYLLNNNNYREIPISIADYLSYENKNIKLSK